MYRQRPIYPGAVTELIVDKPDSFKGEANYYPQYSRDPRFQGDPRYYGPNFPFKGPYGAPSGNTGASPIIGCACVLVVLIVVVIIGLGLGLGFGLSGNSGTTDTNNVPSITQAPGVPVITQAPVNPGVDENNFVTVDTTLDTTVPYNSDFADSSSPAFQGLGDIVLPSVGRSLQSSSLSSIYAGSELISATDLNGNTRVGVRIFLRARSPLDVTDASSALQSAETSVQSILATDSLNGDIGDPQSSVGVTPNGVQSTRRGITASPPTSTGTGTGTGTGTSTLSAVCPSDIFRFADRGQNSASVTWSAPTVSGNDGPVTFSYSPNIGSTFQVGTTTVVATVTDSRSSFQCDFDVTVQANSEALSIICPPNIVQNTDSGQPYATVQYGDGQVSGQQGFISITYNPPTGHQFQLGVTVVTGTAMDNANTVSCSFQVTVRDNEPPVLNCPASRMVPTDQGRSFATIAHVVPTVTDNVDNILAVSTSNSPTMVEYPLGRHVIQATATDSSGNRGSCSWSYDVSDEEPPSVVCPTPFTIRLPSTLSSVVVSFAGRVSFSDNVPAGVTTLFQPNDFRPFEAGTHTVAVTVTDGSGNAATCNFQFTVSALCGRGSLTQPRIIGGDDAQAGQYPWMASLSGGSHICGSFIINENWVVSAAHCRPMVTVGTNVIAGDVSLVSASVNRQTRRVSQAISHPSYVDIPTHDIVLLRLNDPLTYTDYVTPVCLTEETEEPSLYGTDSCHVAGWGITVLASMDPSNLLQDLRVNVYDTQTCIDNFFSTRGDITTNTICAGISQGGADACDGDSGGALVCPDAASQWHAVGVVSSGVGCAQPNSPGFYTRVSQYVDFIYAYIGAELVIVELGTPRTLVSPQGNNGNYPNDAVKGWRFRRFEGNSISLTFQRFDLASGDTLTLGRGLDPSDESSMIQIMQSGFSTTMQSISERDIWFRFVSDASNTAEGFTIELRVVN